MKLFSNPRHFNHLHFSLNEQGILHGTHVLSTSHVCTGKPQLFNCAMMAVALETAEEWKAISPALGGPFRTCFQDTGLRKPASPQALPLASLRFSLIHPEEVHGAPTLNYRGLQSQNLL